MQFNLDLKNELKIENNVYMPHISLTYNDFDMSMREKIVNSIHFAEEKFEIESLAIIKELPDPNDWKFDTIIKF